MNVRKTCRLAVMSLSLAGLSMLPIASVSMLPLTGCDKVAEAQSELCCSDFTPGADLSGVDWGLEGQAEVNYGAIMQAVADFTGSATALVTDVTNACRAIALDLGADPTAVKVTKPNERAQAWCALAIEAINDASADLQISYQPPSCTIDASVQANCEAKCDISGSCNVDPGAIEARCEPAMLSGRCEGTCEGKCEGSANLAVACEGTCEGTCEGECDGTCSTGDESACRGACNGTCRGECRGTCQIEAGANVTCNAECTGGCQGELKAPKCKAVLEPPSADCNLDADCSASCEASASARADCKEPSIDIVGSEDASAVIATLRANLPKLLVVAKARGDLLVKNAQAVVDAAGKLEVGGSFKAGACLIPATAAMSQALRNVEAGFSASVDVMGALNIQ